MLQFIIIIIIVVIIIIIKNNLGRNASNFKKILHLDKMLTLKRSSGWAELQENTAMTVLLLCTTQKTLLRRKAEYTWQTALLSQCKYNSCQFSSLQSSLDGFSQQRTPLTAAWQCYCNRPLHPEWHRLFSLHSGAKTDPEQPLPSSGIAQACPEMLIALNPVLLKIGLRAVQIHSRFLKWPETKPCWEERKPCWCSTVLSVWLWKGKKVEAKYLTRTHGSAFLISKVRAKKLSVT